MKIQTWKDLKEFCNTLSDTQLLTTMAFATPEQQTKLEICVEIMAEDYLINKEDNEIQGNRSDAEKWDDFIEEDYYTTWRAGDPLLFSND